MLRLSTLAFALALSVALSAGATTYVPVTFDELVTRADVIFVGVVTDVRSFPVTSARDGTIIKTRVIFRVLDPVWGTTSVQEVFEFLGGEWNDVRMEVAEMPRFTVGDRRVVFARRERSINPIVGFTQGLFEIRRDSEGVDRLFTLAGLPLAQAENIGSPTANNSVGLVTPIRLSDFRNRISRALSARRER